MTPPILQYQHMLMALHTYTTCVVLFVYSASYLNTYGHEHWQDFASQNYFDKNGAFISAVYSAPLLLMALGMLVCHLVAPAHSIPMHHNAC
jgi:hypothetical protein